MVLTLAALIFLGAPPHRVAVAVIGPSEPALKLQRELEATLASSGFPVSPALGWSVRLAAPASPKPAAPNPGFDDLVKEVAGAFYDGRLDEAIAKLAQATALLRPWVNADPAQLQKAFLWEATLATSRNETPAAENAVRLLLLLAPEATVDLKVFPPPVADLVEEIRKGMRPVELRINGGPSANAEITADEVPLASPFLVPAGRHLIGVRAPGLRPATAWLGETDRSISFSLAPSFAPQEAALAAMVTERQAAGPPQAEVLTAAAAETLVVAVIDPVQHTARAVIWTRGSPSTTSPSRPFAPDDAELAASIVRQLRPPPVATAPGWEFRADAGAGVAFLQTSLSGTTVPAAPLPGGAITLHLAGPSALLAAQASRGPLAFSLDFSGAAFQTSSVVYQGAGLGSPGGGSLLTARLQAQWWSGAAGDPGRTQFGVGLSAFHQDYDNTSDGREGVLTGWERNGVAVEVRGRIGAAWVGGGPLTLEAAVGVSPFSELAENPALSGQSPQASVSPRGELSAGWSGLHWQARLGLEAESFTESFQGSSSIAYDTLSNVRRANTLVWAGFSLGRRF